MISYDTTAKWSAQGSVVTITFNLTSTRIADGKTVKISGTRTVTNTSGGLIADLTSGASVTHTISDNTTVTFDNGSQRTWTSNITRAFTLDASGSLVVTTNGSTSGTNRFGHNFGATIVGLVSPESCGYRYTAGVVTYTGGAGGTSVTTFGYGSNGSCEDTLHYYFTWTGPNGNATYTYTGSY